MTVAFNRAAFPSRNGRAQGATHQAAFPNARVRFSCGACFSVRIPVLSDGEHSSAKAITSPFSSRRWSNRDGYAGPNAPSMTAKLVAGGTVLF